MTVPSRGTRVRRGGRRPGWLLLTALLALAIAASSALVFTNRVELLKLAVILALWAAVLAAFVSMMYRRQSDVDQARARDLKLVYDLQLDREISARREYELTVESQLRRELTSELRAQAADEVAGLRAELAALRTSLEILFDTDLGQRPELETERTTVHAYSDRVAAAHSEDTAGETAENPIIDVPEVGAAPADGGSLMTHQQTAEDVYQDVEGYHDLDWGPAVDGGWPPQEQPEPPGWQRYDQPEPQSEGDQPDAGMPPAADEPPPESPAAKPAARHRSAEEPSDNGHVQTGGQPVAELLARLQSASTGDGRRRRRRAD